MKNTVCSFSLPLDLVQLLKAAADEENTPVSWLVAAALRKHLQGGDSDEE